MKPLETVSRRVVLDFSPRLRVESHRVRVPDGRVVEDWPWIVTRDYAIVVARNKEGRFLIFRQPKYAIEGTSLAPVGGYLEADEPPSAAARRELLEEMGCRAETWSLLGSFQADGNYGAGVAHLFLATEAVKVAEPNSDDVEEQETLSLSLEELREAVLSGQFKVLAWSAAVAMALLKLS
jgi:ADP-ribose pyrophosphatase